MTEERLPLAELLAKAGDGEFFRRVPELRSVEMAIPTSERWVSSLVRDLASRTDNVVIDLMGAATNDTQVAMALMAVLLAPTSSGATRPRVESFLREQYERVWAQVLATAFGDRAAWKEMTYSADIPHLHARDSNAARNFIAVFEEMMALIPVAAAAAA